MADTNIYRIYLIEFWGTRHVMYHILSVWYLLAFLILPIHNMRYIIDYDIINYRPMPILILVFKPKFGCSNLCSLFTVIKFQTVVWLLCHQPAWTGSQLCRLYILAVWFIAVLGKVKDFLGVMAKANEKLELSAHVWPLLLVKWNYWLFIYWK